MELWINDKELPAKSNYLDLIEQVMNEIKPEPCLLCGAITEVRGIFKPENPEQFGAPKGQCKFINYPICSKCLEAEGALERIAKIIYMAYKNVEAKKN